MKAILTLLLLIPTIAVRPSTVSKVNYDLIYVGYFGCNLDQTPEAKKIELDRFVKSMVKKCTTASDLKATVTQANLSAQFCSNGNYKLVARYKCVKK